jgi:hypothetical protein
MIALSYAVFSKPLKQWMTKLSKKPEPKVAPSQPMPPIKLKSARWDDRSRVLVFGEFSYGFASQRFSGGATTQKLWAGLEFGSNRYRQFPRRTPNRGSGNSGYFIYPTLRKIQPELVRKWEEAFATILEKWG